MPIFLTNEAEYSRSSVKQETSRFRRELGATPVCSCELAFNYFTGHGDEQVASALRS